MYTQLRLKQPWSVIGVTGVITMTIIDRVLATSFAALKVPSLYTNKTPKQLVCLLEDCWKQSKHLLQSHNVYTDIRSNVCRLTANVYTWC